MLNELWQNMNDDDWYTLDKDEKGKSLDIPANLDDEAKAARDCDKTDTYCNIQDWFKVNPEIIAAKKLSEDAGEKQISLNLEEDERDWTEKPPGRKELVCPYEEGEEAIGTAAFDNL